MVLNCYFEISLNSLSSLKIEVYQEKSANATFLSSFLSQGNVKAGDTVDSQWKRQQLVEIWEVLDVS